MQMADVNVADEIRARTAKAEPVATSIAAPVVPTMAAVRDGEYTLLEKLPSMYRLYAPGTEIFGRPLKVLEVKRLASLTSRNSNAVINDVVRRATKGLDVEHMLIADKMFILLWLRAQTFPASGYTVSFDCPSCNQNSTYEFDLSAVDVSFLKDSFTEKDFTITLPISKDVLTFHFATAGDERRKEAFLNSVQKNAIREFNEEILGMTMMIDTINDKKVGIGEKYEYLTRDVFSPTDYAYIESSIFRFDFGPSPYLNVRCKKCGETVRTLLQFDSEFFLPKYQFDDVA